MTGRSGRNTVAVIPALNEAATIASVVRGLQPLADAIVVDDGSRDNTAQLAREAGATVVEHPINRGYDAALESGFAHAAQLGYEYVITIDADGQHDPGALTQVYALLQQGAALVVGVRDKRQRWSERLFSWVGKRLWRLDDPLCGLKGYTTQLYRQAGAFDTYRSIGTELAIRSVVSGATTKQFPVKTRPRVDAPRFGSSLRANLKICRALCIGIWHTMTQFPIATGKQAQ